MGFWDCRPEWVLKCVGVNIRPGSICFFKVLGGYLSESKWSLFVVALVRC